MAGHPITESLRALYAPTCTEQLANLREVGAGVTNALLELARAPCADKAERLAIMLGGAQRSAARLAHELAAQERAARAAAEVRDA